MKPTPLSPEDATRLFMGSRANPFAITAILELDRPLSRAELTERVRERLLADVRFRSAIVEHGPLSPPTWSERRVELDWHVDEIATAGDDRSLSRAVEGCARLPFDEARPRWRAWVIDRGGVRSAIVLRVHHALADGHALFGALLRFSDEGAEFPAPPAPESVPFRWPSPGGAATRVGSLARVVLRPRDALSRGVPWSRRLQFGWREPLALDRVKAAAHRFDVHVTELLLAAIAPALVPLLPRRPRPVHALVPVAVPTGPGGGNHFVSVFVPLPVTERSLERRVAAVRLALAEARADAAMSFSRGLVQIAGVLGSHVEHAGIALLARRASIVVSSISGPPIRGHVFGRTIDGIVACVPAPGSVPLALSAVGYAGQLRLSLGAGARLGDPNPILDAVVSELERASAGGAPGQP